MVSNLMKILLAGMVYPALAQTHPAPIPITLYGDAHFPPYSYENRQTHELNGIYPVLLEKIASHMPEYELAFKPIEWKTGLKKLERGEIFGVFLAHRRPSTRPYMDYAKEPILPEDIMLYCAPRLFKNKPLASFVWPDDFYGLTFGAKSGFSGGGSVLWDAINDNKINLREFQSGLENLKALGPITDCYFNDKISVLFDLKNLSHANLPIEVLKLSSEYGYLGVTNRDQGKFTFKQKFLNQFNQVVSQMRNKGEIIKIYRDFLTS